MELFDSHAHYNDEKFETDRKQILKEVYDSGVTKLVCAGYSLESSKKALQIANEYNFIYATAGISPNDIPKIDEALISNAQDINVASNISKALERNNVPSTSNALEINNVTTTSNKTNIEEALSNVTETTTSKEAVNLKEAEFKKQLQKQLEEIENLAQNKKIVAIGEIGLDYYWNKENKENQKYAFIKQIELANELNLPIVIHTREAVADTIDILKNQITVQKKGIFHCCPLNVELIKEGLKLGFYISFAGPITFKNAKNAEDAIKAVPLDKILIETDSPYLAPEPVRGTRNNSSNVKYMAIKIAKVKNIEPEEVAKITYQNAQKILEIQ